MKQLFIILALFATVTFSSCSDFLEEDVRGQENLDTYFQSEADAEAFLTGCYNAITYHGWWQIENFWILTDMCSDDLWMGNTIQDQVDIFLWLIIRELDKGTVLFLIFGNTVIRVFCDAILP